MDPRLGDEAKALIAFVVKNFPISKDLNVAVMRQRSEDVNQKINENLIATFKGVKQERSIKIDDQTDIPVTIYTPVDVKKDKIVVYFHGGGWTQGSRRTHQTIVNMLADATKSTWISVEYRLGPEHKFPIWLDDCCEATRYIVAHKEEFGGDENTKVGVAGDSAGGLNSASVCFSVKNIDFQILVYGAFSFDFHGGSFDEFTRPEHLLTPTLLSWLCENALASQEDGLNPRASVLLQESFEGLPPCLFIVAELDPLRDQSYQYKEKLDAAGVSTKLVLIKDVVHGFFHLPGIFPKACGESIAAIKEFMETL